MRSGLPRCTCFFHVLQRFGQPFPKRLSFEFDPIRRLDQSIQQCIGNRGVGHVLMPVFDGQLTGCNGGSFLNAVVQQLEEIFLLGLGQLDQAPVIENQDIQFAQLAQKLEIPSICPGKTQFFQN